MKRISLCIFAFIIIFLTLCGCSNTNNYKNEQVAHIKALNDSIDDDIDDLVSFYRDSNPSLNDIKLSSDTIDSINDNVEKLEGELTTFNNENNDELAHDTDMFEQYAEIITDLKEWRDDLIHGYGNNSGLGQTWRSIYDSKKALAIANNKQIIKEGKPDYQSIIGEE